MCTGGALIKMLGLGTGLTEALLNRGVDTWIYNSPFILSLIRTRSVITVNDLICMNTLKHDGHLFLMLVCFGLLLHWLITGMLCSAKVALVNCIL